MTSAETWEYLAKLWSNPWLGCNGFVSVRVFDKSVCYGLCGCLTDMVESKLLSRRTASNMLRSIEKMEKGIPTKLPPGTGYLWPLTIEGAKERVAFCQAMAKKCRKREKTKPGHASKPGWQK